MMEGRVDSVEIVDRVAGKVRERLSQMECMRRKISLKAKQAEELGYSVVEAVKGGVIEKSYALRAADKLLHIIMIMG